MWKIKTSKSREALNKWLAAREGRIQWEQIFVNNGFGVTYRPLRFIG